MNLLLDLKINNTVFQNVHKTFIKYIKHTEVINIHLFIKAKTQVFLKELIFHKKGALSKTNVSKVLFQKNVCTIKEDFLFFHYIFYRVYFTTDIFEYLFFTIPC